MTTWVRVGLAKRDIFVFGCLGERDVGVVAVEVAEGVVDGWTKILYFIVFFKSL